MERELDPRIAMAENVSRLTAVFSSPQRILTLSILCATGVDLRIRDIAKRLDDFSDNGTTIPTSTVSNYLNSLLDAQLAERSGNAYKPTEAGILMYKKLKEIHEDISPILTKQKIKDFISQVGDAPLEVIDGLINVLEKMKPSGTTSTD